MKAATRPTPRTKALRSRKSRATSADFRASQTKAEADATLELIALASENTLAANPLIGVHRHEVVIAARALLRAFGKSPRRVGSHLGHVAGELRAVVAGRSAIAPDPKDRRYAHPAWQHKVFKRFMQTHIVVQRELTAFIAQSRLGKSDKGRAQFFADLLTDALAPSNFPLTNPLAIGLGVQTRGRSLLQGAKNLLHDARHNHFLPSSVDATPFQVGVNMATAKGAVVLRHELFELLQFAPTTPDVYARPLLVSPPQVNKYYVMDLAPEKSLVKWITDSGVQFFVISWRNPTEANRHWGIDEYVGAIDAAVDAVRAITGSADVNMWGSCSGGMTLAAYLGWQAALGGTKVANTCWAVCILDSAAAVDDTTLGLFSTPEALEVGKARSQRRGLVRGHEMAAMFAWLRPNDLIWSYWVNNYLLGNKPPAFDLLAWNADTTNMAGQFHCDLLDLLAKNPYVKPGTLKVRGVPIDFAQVRHGAYVIAGITDHITPWRGCYGTARLFGEDTTFVLANAGHIQSLINPPGSKRAFFLSGPADVNDAEAWAERHVDSRVEGSWWPHWRQWIQARSGETIAAPRKLGSRKYPPLCAAPGEYVLEA